MSTYPLAVYHSLYWTNYVSFQPVPPCLQQSIMETLLIIRHCSYDDHSEITIFLSANKKENQIFQRWVHNTMNYADLR